MQKLLIKEFLKDNKNHPSAYDVYREIKKNIPTISFTTVYNNLQRMLEKNEIKEIVVDGQAKRFDPDISPHDHFICVECGNIYDVDKTDVKFNLKGYKIISYEIIIKGICNKCLKRR